MAEMSYDVVFVGGGHKALVTAMYLTKYGGLKVGMFEERHELGTGWSSEEPSPGFVGNTCSNNHYSWYQTPLYLDFPEFLDYGARYVCTPTTVGTIFEDDTCFLQYSAFPEVDPSQERTANNIRKFSEKDAETYLRLWDKVINYWYPAMIEWVFNPARPITEPDAIERLMMNPDAGIDPAWPLMNCTQLFTAIFEDPHTQVGLLRIVQSFGIPTDEPGSGFSALFMTFVSQPFQCYAVGGTHSLTHAAYRIIHENGGEAWTSKKVDKILIENGMAKGVKLADGTEVEAKLAVATNVDPYQLVFDLIGPEKLDPAIARKVKHLSRDFIAITWYSWAFTERPEWKCETFEPWVKYCGWLCYGGTSDLDVNTFIKETHERRAGIWPTELNLGISYMGVNEIDNWDQCMAPPDVGFKILTEQFVLPAWRLSDKEWKERERKHAQEVIELTSKYAPNVNWDIVAGCVPVTPNYTANLARNFAPGGNYSVIDQNLAQGGKHRPIYELAAHRVPGINGLYCTGAAWHPFGGGHCANGYNCYKVMAEDLELKKTWEGRQF